ncbi:hypothetical protein BURK1_01503 [Burkholderiales bacterium]|nr:hypothetical protein BURK1_01503 [Burkholderiales bacterium]
MTLFRRLLIALLVFALPWQGAMASSRWLCVAMSDAPSGVVAPHASQGAQGGHATAMHAAHDAHASPTAHPAAHHGPSDGAHDGGCNLCAACSVTAAAPPAPVVVGAIDVAGAYFPALLVPVPRVVADGLERPPRTA